MTERRPRDPFRREFELETGAPVAPFRRDFDNARDPYTARNALGISPGFISDGDKGDITISGSGATHTIDNDAVTNAKLANEAQSTIKGRASGAGTGDPTDLTPAQVLTILDPAAAELVNVSRTTNQAVTVNTWTKIQFATETTDTEGIYDNATNYRATPTVAGVYLVSVECVMNTADGGYGGAAIYKNGVVVPGGKQLVVSGAALANLISVTTFVPCNGTTDYIEGFGFSSDAVTPQFEGATPSTMRIMRIH